MMDGLKIILVDEYKEEYIVAVNKLLKQLSSRQISFTDKDLFNIIASNASSLYIMYFHNDIIGMFTLCACLSPTGLKYWLEDVVVDEKHRGKSFGKELVKAAIEILSDKGNSKLMLTSRPERIIANKLYMSLGFERRSTNVYNMEIK